MDHRALAESIRLFESGLVSCHRAEDRAQVQAYLAALAPVLASLVLGDMVLERLRAIDRLFGNAWLLDTEPFAPALNKWEEFRRDYQKSVLGGMTVNERLQALSLTEEYDQAVASGNSRTVRVILQTLGVDDESIEKIVFKLEGSS